MGDDGVESTWASVTDERSATLAAAVARVLADDRERRGLVLYMRGQAMGELRRASVRASLNGEEVEPKHVRLAVALAAGAEALDSRMCRWHEDDDGVWDTGCGERYQFIEDGPRENKQRFCGFCGSRILARKAYDEQSTRT